MAYISAEEVKEIRNRIKAAFPLYKWSITGEHGSTVRVALMESDLSFSQNVIQVNHYYVKEHYEDNPKARDVFLKVLDLIYGVKEHVDRSAGNPYADYCDCNYYVNLHVGKWDKPHKTVSYQTVAQKVLSPSTTRRSSIPDIFII